jgi:hypothetical protein
VESADYFQGFVCFNSQAGGTGAGITRLLHDRLYSEFPKKDLVEFSLLPSPNLQESVVSAYNAVLCNFEENTNLSFKVHYDNEALYRIC